MNRTVNLSFVNTPTKILPENIFFNFGDDLDLIISNLDNSLNNTQAKITLFNNKEDLQIFQINQNLTVTSNTGNLSLTGSLLESPGIENNKLYFLKIEVPSTNLILGIYPFWCQNGPVVNVGGITPPEEFFVNQSLGYISPKKFGAIGDGINNDYQALQDTINYASINGLTVMLDGCFNCFGNTVVYPKHTSIVGTSKFGLEIGGKKLPQLLNLKLISAGFNIYNLNGFNANSANGCSFANFLINFYAVSIDNLNKPDNVFVSSGLGWYHHGTAFSMVNVLATNAQGEVFVAMTPPNYTDANLFGSTYGDVGHAVITGCIFRNGSGDGLHKQANDAMISNCYAEFNQGWGFNFDSPAGGNPKQRSLGTIGVSLHPFLNELGGIKLADEVDSTVAGNGQFIGCEIEGVKGTALSIGKGASGTKVTGGRVFLTPVGVKVLAKCDIDTEVRKCGISYQIGDATTVVANCRIKGEVSVFPTDTSPSIGPAHPLPQAAFRVDNATNNTTNNSFDVNVILFDDSTTAGLWNYQAVYSTVSNTDSTNRFNAFFNNATSSTKNYGRVVAKTGAGVTRHTADNSPLPVSQIQSNWNETDVNSRQFIQNKPLVEATNFVTPIPRGSGGTRHWGLFGAGFNSQGTTTITANNLRFIPFFVPKTTTLSALKFEVTTAPASNANIRFGIYSTNSDLQPTTLQYDSGNIAVASGFTGALTASPTTVLTIGWYLLACNVDVTMGVRSLVTPSPFVADPLGATPFIQRFDLVSTFGAYPASGATINWNAVNQSNGGLQHICVFQYTQ